MNVEAITAEAEEDGLTLEEAVMGAYLARALHDMIGMPMELAVHIAADAIPERKVSDRLREVLDRELPGLADAIDGDLQDTGFSERVMADFSRRTKGDSTIH